MFMYIHIHIYVYTHTYAYIYIYAYTYTYIDMVHLVFTREKLLSDWSFPCCERDRSYLDMPQPKPASPRYT